MQGTVAPSQFEMGLSSIASILANISQQTEQGNDFARNISGELHTFFNDVKQPFLSIYSRSVTYQDKMLSYVEQQTNKLTGIYESLITYFNQQNKPPNTIPTNDSITKPEQQSTGIFDKISKNVEGILKHLQKDSSDVSGKGASSTSGFFDGINIFAQSLVLIKKNLNNALIKNMDKFSDVYHRLTEKNSNDNAKAFTENFEKLGDSLDNLSKRLREPAKILGYLALSFVVLQLTILSPLFTTMMLGIGAFIFILSRVTNDKQFNPGIKDFAFGIATLSVALIMMNFIQWESLGKMIVFVGALGLALRTYTTIPGADKSLLYLAVGITMLVIASIAMAYISWESLGKMVLFIVGLNFALRSFSGPSGMGSDIKSSPMMLFAFGIAVLTLAMFAMTELPWEGIFKMIIFIGLLGLTMKLFNFNRMGPANGMIQFSFGIAVLVLAMYAIDELPWETVWKMITFIGALGLTIRLINGRGVPPLLSFAFGLGVMVLAMYAMDELPWEAIGKTLLFLGGLGLVLKLFGTTSGLTMIGIGAGIGILVLALKYFKDSGFTLTDTLNFVCAIGGIAAILAVIGVPAIAGLVGLGALVVAGIGVALLASGAGFKMISDLNISVDNLINYFKGITIISLGFAALSGAMVFALIGATLFIPVAVASLIGAGALLAISKINLDVKKLGTYNTQVKALVDNINEFGIIEISKAGIKSLALIPIFTAGYLGAALLSKISGIEINKEKLGLFGGMMNYMVDTILTSLVDNESKMEAAKPGLIALSKLLNISKGLAETIQMMANLKFYEYGVENGKLVLKGVRQLTTNDFKMVGVNLGTMLQTLINPLAILGSKSDMLTIGGKTFANPFKNNTTLAGIEVLSKMGQAYKPLAESIKTLAESGVMTDPKLTKRFTDSLMSITAVYLWIFQKLGKIDTSLISKSIGQITRFNNGFKDIPTDQIKTLDTLFGRFINNLSDDIKWKKLRSNLRFMRLEFEAMTKSMNTLNIEKATLFEKNIRNLIEKNNGQGLKEAAESLKQLLDLVETNQNVSTGTTTNTNPFLNPFSTPSTVATPVKEKQKPQTEKLSNVAVEQLATILESVKQLLAGIDSKLGNTLKVRQVTGAGNTI